MTYKKGMVSTRNIAGSAMGTGKRKGLWGDSSARRPHWSRRPEEVRCRVDRGDSWRRAGYCDGGLEMGVIGEGQAESSPLYPLVGMTTRRGKFEH